MTPSTSLAVVVLAAGKGTRMKSELPKVLHEMCGRPLVAFAVDRALDLGATRVTVVVGHGAAQVEARLTDLFPAQQLAFAVQSPQLGTGHAVMSAKTQGGLGEGDVLILSGDVPLLGHDTLERLLKARRESGAAVALVSTVPPTPTGYGRVIRNASSGVERIVEEKDASADERSVREVNAGVYCVDAAFLSSALDQLTPQNAQGEYYLTDIVALAREADRQVVAVEAGFVETSGINDRAQLADAESALRRELNAALMRSGVTMRDPGSTYIDVGVEVGQDTVIEPNVSLQGHTRVGRGGHIGQGAVIVDSTLSDGVVVKPYSHLEQAIVGSGSIVGPFARLRPGADLANDVHVGNFVEIKKSRIGNGSKANHLAYIGDAEIGSGCNVGAGTITCNYDGVHKYKTVLGDGVFIGSDSQLVAPVTIGDGAYVGAGSTITKDVPAQALAFTRPTQTVKEGWALRRKAKQQAEAEAKAASGEHKS